MCCSKGCTLALFVHMYFAELFLYLFDSKQTCHEKVADVCELMPIPDKFDDAIKDRPSLKLKSGRGDPLQCNGETFAVWEVFYMHAKRLSASLDAASVRELEQGSADFYVEPVLEAVEFLLGLCVNLRELLY